MRCAFEIGALMLAMTAAPAFAQQADRHADHQTAVQEAVPGKPATNVPKPSGHPRHDHDCCPMMDKESAGHSRSADKATGADMMTDGMMNPSQDRAPPKHGHAHK